MAEPQTAAGWYPDPEDQAQMRWWDGSGWSEQRQPAQAQPALSVVPVQGDAPSAGKAMAAGILALLFNVLFIPSILAIKWGGAAKREIAASGGQLTGAGKATFAKVAGWLGVVFGLVALVAVVLMVAAGGAVVAEAGKDADYKNAVAAAMDRSNAAIEDLDAADPTPAEAKAAMTELEASIDELEGVTPPDKVKAEHDQLVAGMRTMVAGLEQVQQAEQAPAAKSLELVSAGLDKFLTGSGQVIDSAAAIDAKLLA